MQQFKHKIMLILTLVLAVFLGFGLFTALQALATKR